MRLTLRTLDAFFGAGTPEGGDRQQAEKVYVLEGGSVAEAIAELPEATGLLPLFSQVRLVALSAEAARRGTESALLYLITETRLRSDVLLCVAGEDAQTLIGTELGAASGSAVLLEEAVRTGREAGSTAFLPLYRFFSLARGNENAAYCPVLTLLPDGSGGMRPAAGGIALFTGDRFTAVLPASDAAAFLLLTGGARRAQFTAAEETGARFAFRITRASARVLVRADAGRTYAEIAVSARCALPEAAARPGLSEDEALAAAQKTLAAELEHCLAFLTRGGYDPCRIRKTAALRNGEAAREADFEVAVRTELRPE